MLGDEKVRPVRLGGPDADSYPEFGNASRTSMSCHSMGSEARTTSATGSGRQLGAGLDRVPWPTKFTVESSSGARRFSPATMIPAFHKILHFPRTVDLILPRAAFQSLVASSS